MLSAAENELLTRTDKGTAAGDYFRRFWMPALLSEEGVHRCVAGYLTYAELHGIIRHYGDSIVLAPGRPAEITVTPGDVGYRQAPLRYAANEMREMAGAAPAQFDTLAM